MANKKTTTTNTNVVASNVADVYLNYAVQQQLKAADVPPRKKLDISFSDASKIGNKKSKSNQSAYEKSSDQLYEGKSRNSISWRRYVVYMILITMLSCCFTYSKYMSEAGGKATVTAAKFSYSISGTTADGVTISKDPENPTKIDFTSVDPKACSFTVVNTSEVPVSVIPVVSGNDGFTISFTDGSGNIVDADHPLKFTSTGEASIVMNITPANKTKATVNMNLDFKVEQTS